MRGGIPAFVTINKAIASKQIIGSEYQPYELLAQ